MHKNHSVISQDPKMASLTLHLIVIALLASTALSTATRQRGRVAGSQGEGVVVGGRGTGGVASTTSTEAPTLRAPRQRRPPTTQSIDMTMTTAAATTQQHFQYNNNNKHNSWNTFGWKSFQGSWKCEGATTTKGYTGHGIRRSWQPAPPTATPYYAHTPTSSPTSSYSYSSSDAAANASASAISSYSSTSSRGALKTPRMIQRLVAGHIHNSQGHSTYEVSAVSANSSTTSYGPSKPDRSTSSTTTTTTTTTTTRQPPARGKASSSYRLAKPSTRPRLTSTVATTRFSHPPSSSRTTTPLPLPLPLPLPSNTPNPYREVDDDEALLNEPDDFDNWDNGILRLSAGSGKEAEAPAKKPPKEDAKKTLADQVRDGKYGLIEKELFRRVPKRPGVLSYARNSEVPLDNERNYGGLNEEDIWLAEDHLLVIKGGALNEEAEDNQQGPWPAIDDYDAPGRQIKLPPNPAVPPPFPVQLEPHGPLQLIRDNQLEILRPAAGNATLSAKAGHYQSHAGTAAENLASHPAARSGAPAASAPASAEAPQAPAYVYPAPYAPWLLYPNDTVASKGLLRSPPLLGPWLINGLNGNGSLAADSPLPGNVSDFDEDDPSLYYPPAYTFVYKSNYSNPVPPGPLVPGIVLPPPPDHFSRLEVTSSSTRRPPSTSSTTTTSSSTTSSSSTTTSTSTTSTTSRPPVHLPPIRTSYKPKYNAITYLPPPPRQNSPKYVERVPVPVAVPIPIYPVNYTPRPPQPPQAPQLVFVPSSTEGSRQEQSPLDLDPPLSKSNPIYYEYFEAKRQPGSIKSNVIDDFLATKPPKRHHHHHHTGHSHHQREHLQHYKASPSPANEVAPEVVNITPKPRTAQLQLHAEYEASLGQLLRSNLVSPPGASNAGRFQVRLGFIIGLPTYLFKH
ncbi:hypothetical protein M5D96_012747 [Drosophila gunungcola]|uniref:Mucin-5AC n=1 Tax=Drosophila gunungcola TaxID=103775 RepID=A0A9P9YCL0_9MUSC|nr:hypothetical protein M5D96_012747 [Drosophila gunungcola]